MQTKKYTLHEDPGHGWLEVPREELVSLGIEARITPWSFQSEDSKGVVTVYLEEDCDLSTFFDAHKSKHGKFPEYTTHTINGNSWIRQLRSYRAPVTNHASIVDGCWCVNCQEWRTTYEMLLHVAAADIDMQYFASRTRHIGKDSLAWKYLISVMDIETLAIRPGVNLPPIKGEYVKLLNGNREDIKKFLGELGTSLYLIEDRTGKTYAVCPLDEPNVTWSRCWQETETSAP